MNPSVAQGAWIAVRARPDRRDRAAEPQGVRKVAVRSRRGRPGAVMSQQQREQPGTITTAATIAADAAIRSAAEAPGSAPSAASGRSLGRSEDRRRAPERGDAEPERGEAGPQKTRLLPFDAMTKARIAAHGERAEGPHGGFERFPRSAWLSGRTSVRKQSRRLRAMRHRRRPRADRGCSGRPSPVEATAVCRLATGRVRGCFRTWPPPLRGSEPS